MSRWQTFNKVLLCIAKHIDVYRIIPRILAVGYGWLVWKICHWFMALPNPNMNHAAFVSAVIGAAAVIFTLYVRTGHDWSTEAIQQDSSAGTTTPNLPPEN